MECYFYSGGKCACEDGASGSDEDSRCKTKGKRGRNQCSSFLDPEDMEEEDNDEDN